MAKDVALTRSHSPVYWPYFILVFGSPLSRFVFGRWLPSYIADGVSFFILFAIASFVVARLWRNDARFGRILAASAGAALIAILIRYAFP